MQRRFEISRLIALIASYVVKYDGKISHKQENLQCFIKPMLNVVMKISSCHGNALSFPWSTPFKAPVAQRMAGYRPRQHCASGIQQ